MELAWTILHLLKAWFRSQGLQLQVSLRAWGRMIGMAKTWGETKYAIRALPIGGYVSMEGENEDSGDPRAFCARKGMETHF